jgi:hypothetical protein
MIFSIISVNLFGLGSISANAEWKQNSNGQWNYFRLDGAKITGWLKDLDGKWYFFKADGNMLSNNWLNENSKWYYFDNSGAWNPNITDNPNSGNNNLPISIPSTWKSLGDNKYAINGRSVVTYSVEDMTGWTQESVMNDIRKITYQQGNYDSDMGLVTYNGNNGYAYSYTSITKDSMRKILYIIMFKNNKHYDFIFISDYVNYDTDRKEFENVLNSSLNI